MNFSDPPRRRPAENLLPMINVVFLLLIFFLLAARLVPPEPFAVESPVSRAEREALGEFTLFVAADGGLGFRDVVGAEAMAAAADARVALCAEVDCAVTAPKLTLRADRALPAADLARLMPRLAALGFDEVELLVWGGAP